MRLGSAGRPGGVAQFAISYYAPANATTQPGPPLVGLPILGYSLMSPPGAKWSVVLQ